MTRSDSFPIIKDYFLMAALLVAATLVGLIFRSVGFPETNIVIVYLLAVQLIAALTAGYRYGVLAALFAPGAFDYFFAEPFYEFDVQAERYIVTLVIMTVTALVTGGITSRSKQNERAAKAMESETRALYTLTNELADASEEDAIVAIAVKAIRRATGSEDVVYLPPEAVKAADAEAHRLLSIGGADADMGAILLPESRSAYGKTASAKDRFLTAVSGKTVSAKSRFLTAVSEKTVSAGGRFLTAISERTVPAEGRFLTAISENTALALSRAKSVRQRAIAAEEARAERHRSEFLRAVSHDLRTPLMGLIGTSEMILERTEKNDPRYALAEAIRADSEWLRTLIVNLLDLTRLRSGKLVLNKQSEAVEEVVGDAVLRVVRCFEGRNIDVRVPDALMLVPMDAGLIRQVLVNLLENAVKHTPTPNEILVTVERGKNKEVRFSVSDRGEGIDPAALPHIFRAFYTSGPADPHTKRSAGPADLHAKHSVGLGLAICEAVVTAHGGTITAENRTDGPGARFTFTLPTEDAS
ncbi:MAG: DUF4118 domain-containing protein [Clostridiales Family XIII bacterium]|jgi:two-component system sensor histidine kinase KdpD|nr:DUF4118 domain-containing protein [Clostridiales Family XIII bacterium]